MSIGYLRARGLRRTDLLIGKYFGFTVWRSALAVSHIDASMNLSRSQHPPRPARRNYCVQSPFVDRVSFRRRNWHGAATATFADQVDDFQSTPRCWIFEILKVASSD
jgi:hypothetical protein